MVELSASKLSLSTFSSEDLWHKTGRLENSKSELFQLEDRKGGRYLLSPTHEEEITSLVGSIVKSYKELPLRLYQISRKYRDEPRPRQGLLRTREFLMKDLYTFDTTREEALKTYEIVRQAYTGLFDELKIPYLTAEASSGEIGGDLSHEYHITTPKGEDKIVSCDACDYVANEEVAESKINGRIRELHFPNQSTLGIVDSSILMDFPNNELQTQPMSTQWFGITKDRSTLVQAFLPYEGMISTSNGLQCRKPEINPYVIRRLCPQLDLSVENPVKAWNDHHQALTASGRESPNGRHVMRAFDIRHRAHGRMSDLLDLTNLFMNPEAGAQKLYERTAAHECPDRLDLVRIENGDACPRCSKGQLKVETAVELGHTFHLGTRYSRPLSATFLSQDMATTSSQAPMQMGCHGIGVSRLIAAVAERLADVKGLNWPRVIAPFEAVVISTKGQEEGAEEVYDILADKRRPLFPEALNTIIDDRKKEFGWKLNDADLIGYPVIVVVGRDWKKGRECEVQCRRLGVRINVAAMDLRHEVDNILEQL